MSINKASSSKDKVSKVEYAKAKAIHASSIWSGEVASNHQIHAKEKVMQLTNQVSCQQGFGQVANNTFKSVLVRHELGFKPKHPHPHAKYQKKKVSYTMPRLRSTKSTPKKVNNTKPPYVQGQNHAMSIKERRHLISQKC